MSDPQKLTIPYPGTMTPCQGNRVYFWFLSTGVDMRYQKLYEWPDGTTPQRKDGDIVFVPNGGASGPTWDYNGSHQGLSGPEVGCFTTDSPNMSETATIQVSGTGAKGGDWGAYFSNQQIPFSLELSSPSGSHIFRIVTVTDNGSWCELATGSAGFGESIPWPSAPHQLRCTPVIPEP